MSAILFKANEIKLLKICESLLSSYIKRTEKQLPTLEEIRHQLQTRQLMQYIKQGEVLRNGEFQIEVINRSLFAIKR